MPEAGKPCRLNPEKTDGSDKIELSPWFHDQLDILLISYNGHNRQHFPDMCSYPVK
jgi:hypothetical protein